MNLENFDFQNAIKHLDQLKYKMLHVAMFDSDTYLDIIRETLPEHEKQYDELLKLGKTIKQMFDEKIFTRMYINRQTLQVEVS
jgi:hypothetical protein